MIYVALFVHLCLVWINYYISKSLLYPPTAFASLWSVLLLLLIMSGSFFYPISAFTSLIFVLGSLSFSAGGFFTRTRKCCTTCVNSTSKWTRGLFNACILLLIIMFPFFLKQLQHLNALSGFQDFMAGVRYQTSTGIREYDSLGFYSYLTKFGSLCALGAFLQCTSSGYSKVKTFLLFAITFSYGLATGGRTAPLTLLLSLGCMHVLTSKLTIRTTITIATIFLLLFSVPAVLLQKGISNKDTFSENALSLNQNIQLYTLSGLVAFDQAVSGGGARSEGRLFLFVNNLLGAFGFDSKAMSPVLEYSSTPQLTNVYTIYYLYYSDLGLLGLMIVMFILGCLMCLLYRLAVLGDHRYILLYSFGFSCLMTSSNGEAFITCLSNWIQTAVFAFFLYQPPSLIFGKVRPSKVLKFLFPALGKNSAVIFPRGERRRNGLQGLEITNHNSA